jgi:hypothetical protein
MNYKNKPGYRNISSDVTIKYYRSSWEANYARYLAWLKRKKQIKDWGYEVKTFWFDDIKRGVRSYLPDFEVTENDGSVSYHEVKGYMDAKSKTKIKRMRIYYPDVKLIIIDEKQYKLIADKVSKLIECWE